MHAWVIKRTQEIPYLRLEVQYRLPKTNLAYSENSICLELCRTFLAPPADHTGIINKVVLLITQ